MSIPATPAICLAATACMIAAGASHWWSVRQLTASLDPAVLATPAEPAPAANTAITRTPELPPALPMPTAADADVPMPMPPVGEPLAMQQQFYQELLREMQQLRTENRDLLSQVAETNRDLMKLEFRVDTHSEQFRPLPVAEDRFGTTFGTGPDTDPGTSFDGGPGLLPPRALPVEVPVVE